MTPHENDAVLALLLLTTATLPLPCTLKTRIREHRDRLGNSGVGCFGMGTSFLDHMMDQIARHGLVDRLDVKAVGDLHIDAHHTVEDIGIAGQGLRPRPSATRRAFAAMAMPTPMDEALSRVVIDSGRPGLVYSIDFTRASIGQFDVDLFPSSSMASSTTPW